MCISNIGGVRKKSKPLVAIARVDATRLSRNGLLVHGQDAFVIADTAPGIVGHVHVA